MRKGAFPGTAFGWIFIVAGVFFMLLPWLAPHTQGNNPIFFNLIVSADLVVTGFAVIQMERHPQSMAIWAGLIGAAIGASIIAFSVLDPDDSRFHAPRWVVAAAGASFVLASIAAIRTRGDPDSPVQHTPGYGLVLALLLTCFGAVASWVAFGPGERQFYGEFSMGGGVLPFDASEWLGRIFFSPGALLLDLMAAAAWFYLFRGLIRRRRGARDTVEKPRRRE